MLFFQRPATPTPAIEGLRLVRRANARRLALRVDVTQGDICLVVPKRVSDKTAWQFAHKHQGWIQSRLAKMQKPVPFAHGNSIPVFGIERVIEIIPCGGRITLCTLTDTALEVRTPRANPATNIKQFLYSLLEESVAPCAEEKARIIGKNFSKITLRDTRTRWGSCGPNGNLMLCWRLIFAPTAVIDYVVAHEIAHLQHMNHSKKFWDLCAELSNDMDFARKWLSANGDTLLRYGTRP